MYTISIVQIVNNCEALTTITIRQSQNGGTLIKFVFVQGMLLLLLQFLICKAQHIISFISKCILKNVAYINSNLINEQLKYVPGLPKTQPPPCIKKRALSWCSPALG